MVVLQLDPTDACVREAVAVEICLYTNDFQLEKCKPVIEALKVCCKPYDGISVHCGFHDDGGSKKEVKGRGQEVKANRQQY